MKVLIDREKCFKSGECYYNHPELFAMGEEGYPDIKVTDVTDDLLRHAREAIDVCPAVAISLEE